MSAETDEEFLKRVYDEAIDMGLSPEIARFVRDNVSVGNEAKQRSASEARAIVTSYEDIRLSAALANRAMVACRNPSGPISELLRTGSLINAANVASAIGIVEAANTYWTKQ